MSTDQDESVQSNRVIEVFYIQSHVFAKKMAYGSLVGMTKAVR